MAKSNKHEMGHVAFGLARIALGLTFLWAFFDKLFGLGFATCRTPTTNVITTGCSKAWIHGGSPTLGFLKFATKGPFASFYQGLAGHAVVDWLFMLGLLGIGVALTLGIVVRLATLLGAILVVMMWSAALWPANNPVIDEHIIYAIVLIGLMYINDEQKLGLRSWWVKQDLVKKYPVLQ